MALMPGWDLEREPNGTWIGQSTASDEHAESEAVTKPDLYLLSKIAMPSAPLLSFKSCTDFSVTNPNH
jgi:hypothetical protein